MKKKKSLLICYFLIIALIIGPCLDKKSSNYPTSLAGSPASAPATEAGLFCTLLAGCLVAGECLEEAEMERHFIFAIWEMLVDGDTIFLLNRETGARGCGAGTWLMLPVYPI